MDTKLIGNANSKKWAGETGQHVEGWITSWAGESQEEVHAATPKPIAVSTRGRNQGHSDVDHNIVVDPEETHKRRYDNAGSYDTHCVIVANCLEKSLVVSIERPERCRLSWKPTA